MPQIVIEVDAGVVEGADVELRYDLPELIEAASAGAIASRGHDYDEDDHLHVYLAADDVVAALNVVAQVLDSSLVGGVDLSACRVGVREGPGLPFDVVRPDGQGGTIEDLRG